ncbi:DUF427 domain-containing protein [Spirulina subsalsa FACHB-351]|uniref:DUF427 domain-containing protein n=1 Tax=Spirulina subsalsa FACHB-351 TaxID=234711 RepID=A0ABT3L439_9CYAN|nr:DUF427 domain-containing protein [Spirulina subsalsa]MCW6036269.1 DUF427 domain-containing protein [Spirulina subsalsa FACHB-351]
MAKVTLNGVLLAESNNCEVVEGNYYFPPDALKTEYFSDSNTHTICSWKGQASYYNITVGDKTIKDAAWYYPQTKEKAKHIEGYVAFYKNKVQVES